MDSEQNNFLTNRNKNCFNLIRIIAAFDVFLGHYYDAISLEMPFIVSKIWWVFRGVPIFFILSGFLNWNSLSLKNYSFVEFSKKRILRLYPALWIVVFVNSVIILNFLGRTVFGASFILFNIAQSSIFQFWTPDCLRSYGCGTPNGSLWTIGVMVQCYIVLFIVNKLYNKSNKTHCLIIFVIIGVIINIVSPFLKNYLPQIVFKLYLQTFFPYIWLFFLGAYLSEKFDKVVPVLVKLFPIFLLVVIILVLTEFEKNIGVYEPLKCLFLGCFIIGFGYYIQKPVINLDITYSFYLIHMVIINLLLQLKVNDYSFVFSFCLSLFFAILVNEFSLFCFSKNILKIFNFLRLKNK